MPHLTLRKQGIFLYTGHLQAMSLVGKGYNNLADLMVVLECHGWLTLA